MSLSSDGSTRFLFRKRLLFPNSTYMSAAPASSTATPPAAPPMAATGRPSDSGTGAACGSAGPAPEPSVRETVGCCMIDSDPRPFDPIWALSLSSVRSFAAADWADASSLYRSTNAMSINAESSRLRPVVPSVIDVMVTLSADGDAAETASLRRSCLSESKAALVPCMRTPMSTWYWDVESMTLHASASVDPTWDLLPSGQGKQLLPSPKKLARHKHEEPPQVALKRAHSTHSLLDVAPVTPE
mmetsp:Transcript_45417/g.109395  ORF Transcript_45417/g.109395 Transcript_45417/m.109395 type:complete len:243 (-) Transcript_45417:62-790(-)